MPARARGCSTMPSAQLPDKVPVDVILLPMKGDLPAAHRFWQLTRFTQGTLMMPSKDWP